MAADRDEIDDSANETFQIVGGKTDFVPYGRHEGMLTFQTLSGPASALIHSGVTAGFIDAVRAPTGTTMTAKGEVVVNPGSGAKHNAATIVEIHSRPA